MSFAVRLDGKVSREACRCLVPAGASGAMVPLFEDDGERVTDRVE